MNRVQISKYELFSLIILFQWGTTIIFGFGAAAGRDAWIASLISTGIGTALILLYVLIFRLGGDRTLAEWFTYAFGKWVGTPLSWLYPLIFIYNGARIISDIRFLLPVTIMNLTPDWVIGITFLAVVVYAMLGGIEVLARIAAFLLPFLLLAIVLEMILLGASRSLHYVNLLPIVGEGWGRIWETIWPLGIMQTYGESIEFALIWGYVSQKKGLAATTGFATLFAGFFIALLGLLTIAGMGEAVFQQMMYPAFALLKLSRITFIDNLDALGIMYLVINAFIKLSMHLYAASLFIQQLIAAKKIRPVIFVVAGLALLLSMTMVVSFTEHLEVAMVTVPYHLWLPLYLVLPMIVLAVLPLRNWIGGKKS